jgi:hypothetical protein
MISMKQEMEIPPARPVPPPPYIELKHVSEPNKYADYLRKKLSYYRSPDITTLGGDMKAALVKPLDVFRKEVYSMKVSIAQFIEHAYHLATGFVHSHWKGIIVGISVLIALVGFAGITMWLFNNGPFSDIDKNDFDAQSEFTRDKPQPHRTAPAPRKPGNFTKPHVAEMAGADQTSLNLIQGVVGGNLVSLDVNGYKSFGLFVKGRTLVCAAHIMRTSFPCSVTVSSHRSGVRAFSKDKIRVIYHNHQDLAFVTFCDKTYAEYPDISGHFIKHAETHLVERCYVYMAVKTETAVEIRSSPTPAYAGGHLDYPTVFGGPHSVSNDETIFTRIPSTGGDCGSVYLLNNPSLSRKIFGIHIAGGPCSAASIVTQEDIDEAFEALVAEMLPPIDPTCTNSAINPDVIKCENVEVLGTVSSEYSVRCPNSSKMHRSPMYNMWHESKHTLAMLAPKHGISPAEVGESKKLVRPHNTYKHPWLDHYADFVIDKIPYKVEPRLLSIDEAVNGVEGWYHTNGIDMKKSPGYPRNIERISGKQKGKLSYFFKGMNEKGEPHYTPKPELVVDINAVKDSHEAGIEYPFWFVDQLKDEKLPWSKVYNRETAEWIGNTRIMNAAPLHIFITERMLFGAFFENLMRWQSDPDSVCDIGIDPLHAGAWEQVARKVNPNLDPDAEMLLGDLRKCDASVAKSLLELTIDVLVGWYKKRMYGYTPEIERRQRMLLRSLTLNACRIIINLVYRVRAGNSSGIFDTPEFNQIPTMACYSLAEAEKRGEDKMIEGFEAVWRKFKGVGDDSLLGRGKIGDPYRLNIDMFDVKEMFARHGMEYTAIYKDQELVAYYKFSEAKYLQRTFRIENGVVYAPLSKDSLEDIPYFIQKKGDQEYFLRAECDSMLREAYQWGKQYFEDWKTRLNNALKTFCYQPMTLSYRVLDLEFHRAVRDPLSLVNVNRTEFVAQMSEPAHAQRQETQKTEETFIETTTFADNVGKSDPKLEIASVLSPVTIGTDPYPDQGIAGLLSRPYPIANFNWSSSSVAGTFVTSLSLPSALMAIPNIDDKLNRFQYLRAGVRLSIRVNGTQFHSGLLLAAWCPHWAAADPDTIPFFNIYTASSQNCICISANTSATAEVTIPYVAPSSYWNLKDDPTAAADGFFGQMFFFVHNQLRLFNATTTQTIVCTIYASFEQPSVAGLGLRTGATDRARWRKQFIAQMKKDSVTKEQSKRSKNMTMESESKASSPAPFGNMISSFASSLGEMATNMLTEVATDALTALFLDKPTSTTAVQKVTPKTLTSMALATGQDGCDMLSMHPDNHVSTDPSIYVSPADYNLFANYKLLPSLLYLGSFDDTAAIGFKPFVTAVCPTICYGAGVSGGSIYYITHLAHLASYFAYWRGSIKFCFKFSASAFTTARVRLAWIPDPTFSGSFPTNEEGDVVNTIVDITGDTSKTITIPYLRESPWQPVIPPAFTVAPITTWYGFNGQLVMYILNPVTNSQTTGSSTIDFGVWVSGGEDFQVDRPEPLWDGYVDGTGTHVDKSKFVVQMAVNTAVDMRDLFRKPFETIIPATTCIPNGIQMGECVDSFPELLHRYSLLSQLNVEGTATKVVNPWIKHLASSSDIRCNWVRVWKSFLFARGGYRLKLIKINDSISGDDVTQWTMAACNIRFDSTGAQHPGTPDYVSMCDLGQVIEQSTVRPNIECEVPFYTPWNMMCQGYALETYDVPCAYFLINNATSDVETDLFGIYISASDSTSFGWPLNPVPLFVSTSELSKKNQKGGNLPVLRQNGNFNIRQSNKGVSTDNNNSRDNIGVTPSL